MKNILWLASWYPNRLQPYTGDFIERHARAASLHNRITVLFVIKDGRRAMPEKYFIEERKYNKQCSAVILYYHPLSKIKWLDSLFSGLRYCLFFAKLVRQYIRDNGKPDLLHVHVSWRAGLIALYCKWKYKLKYVVTEHWSAFVEGALPSFEQRSFLTKYIVKKVFARAAACSVVSRKLGEALSRRFRIDMPVVIPNVVDTDLFRPAEHLNERFRFIHISDFNYQKNPEQIFEAVSRLQSLTDIPFKMHVFAPAEDKVSMLAEKYSITDNIVYQSYVPQSVLAPEMNRADALVLYSRYETFGCVVIEAIASGVPVIVSDIPVFHEIVQEGDGIFVPLNDAGLLAENMLWMMKNVRRFNKAQMANGARERFGFERVGKMFDELYLK